MSTVALLDSHDAVGEWTLVPDQSSIAFTKKTMWALMTVTGRFAEFNGHAHISDTGEVACQLNISATSVDTGLRMRDKHLRSPDFLKADRFPQINIVITDGRPR